MFIREFDLVESKEMAPLQHLIDKINGQNRDKDNEHKQEDDEDDDDDNEEE